MIFLNAIQTLENNQLIESRFKVFRNEKLAEILSLLCKIRLLFFEKAKSYIK
jgi:hypothetical protein